MKFEPSILRICLRLFASAVFLFALYIFYGPPQYVETDMINSIFYLLWIPAILLPVTIFSCLIAGSPIRLIPKLYLWWMRNPYVALIGLMIGLIMIKVAAGNFAVEAATENSVSKLSDFDQLAPGWITTAFFLLHFYPVRLFNFVLKKTKRYKRFSKNSWDSY